MMAYFSFSGFISDFRFHMVSERLTSFSYHEITTLKRWGQLRFTGEE